MAIKISQDIDLGHDKNRIKDKRDKDRQEATVKAIHNRYFNDDPEKRYELQILADEVGMGKTYVALATAYSILAAMRNGASDADLAGCYQRILIITPQNQALYEKWNQETQEFVKKCIVTNKAEAAQWFTPKGVKRIDELSRELRTPGARPRILITTMGLFSGGKLEDYKLKRRFLLGCCFRYWGVRFRIDLRVNVLKGALEEENWAGNPDQLTALDDREKEKLLFTEAEVLGALAELDRPSNGRKGTTGEVEALLNLCKEIAEPYTRERNKHYLKIQKKLNALYKLLSGLLIKQAFPLVIVDEAHHWKNGPSNGTNGYGEFKNYIADKTRRVLLLTATPFQLNPDELLEIMKVSDDIRPCSTIAESKVRTERLRSFREGVVREALKNSALTSGHFSKEWSRLWRHTTGKDIQDLWASDNFSSTISELDKIAVNILKIDTDKMRDIVDKTVASCNPNMRAFLRKALELHTYNKHLSNVLGASVVRHRRRTDHRLFRIGAECVLNQSEMLCRSDVHLLHSAPGLDVHGAGELPHYLLMRCVTEAKKSKGRRGRSSLGSDLTGCYSTLLESAEGKTIKKWLENSPQGKGYLELLTELVSPQEDVKHPKVMRVVDWTSPVFTDTKLS